MRCAHCGTKVPDGHGVTHSRRHGFCSKACLNAWLPTRVEHLERELNAIYVRARGKARTLALNALIGNVPSAGGHRG